MWQQACADPSKLPERAMLLAQQMTAGLGTLSSGGTLHSSKGGLHISDPIPGAKPLPVPAELAALMNQQVRGTLEGVNTNNIMNSLLLLIILILTPYLEPYSHSYYGGEVGRRFNDNINQIRGRQIP